MVRLPLLSCLLVAAMTVAACNDNGAPEPPATETPSPPSGQSSPRELLRKLYRSLRDGDKEAHMECHFGNPPAYVACSGELFSLWQVIYQFQAKLRTTFGENAWEDYCELGSHVVLPDRDDPSWAENTRIDVKGDSARWYRHGIGPPDELGDEMRRSNGAWYFVMRQANTPEALSDMASDWSEDYQRAMLAMDKPRITLMEVRAAVAGTEVISPPDPPAHP